MVERVQVIVLGVDITFVILNTALYVVRARVSRFDDFPEEPKRALRTEQFTRFGRIRVLNIILTVLNRLKIEAVVKLGLLPALHLRTVI